MTDPIDPRDARSIEMVTRYRDRLIEILQFADAEPFQSQREAYRRVSHVIDDLTLDIMSFYNRSNGDELSQLEQTQVLPALKRLRDILRNSKGSRRELRDTLRKATESTPKMETRVS